VAVPKRLRVAYTLEQCWHDVPGGTAVAALEVARRLADRDDIELIGVAGRHRAQPDPAFRPPIPVRQLAIARPWLYETWNRFGRPMVESATGPVDVCHSTVAIPAGSRAPQVVTVHDVAFVEHPERFTRHGVRVMRAGLERCRTAQRVLVPSEATCRDLLALGFDADRVQVVRWGVDPVLFGDPDVARVRRRYRLPDRFVLFVGTVEPRKNLVRLAEAVARLDRQLPLVVCGADGWGEARPSAGEVRFLGFVPAADLPALYAASSVFAYPSLAEGFGLPIAEAMAAGTPVVTSLGSATEEVAGGAAVLVNPDDAASIASGIEAAVADRASWIDRGRARAAVLSWDATVAATVEVYRQVVSEVGS
jgi:glycosyltransferase involved in cell wall biosynthesis